MSTVFNEDRATDLDSWSTCDGQPATRVEAESGAYAQVGPDDSLNVYSARNELVFQYCPETGRTRMYVPSGDLELVAAHGNINLLASGAVNMHGQTVAISAQRTLKLAVVATSAALSSLISLGRRKVKVQSEQFDMAARKLSAKLETTTVEGDSCESEFRNVRSRAEKIETDADCIVENAGSVFRTVSGLLQQTAGRMKTLVDAIFQLRSKTAILTADDDFKINGDKVHLG